MVVVLSQLLSGDSCLKEKEEDTEGGTLAWKMTWEEVRKKEDLGKSGGTV